MTTEKITKLRAWQKALCEQPCVFGVQVWTKSYGEDPSGYEDSGNMYVSREAAQREVDFWASRATRARVVNLGHLHTDELSLERWG